MVNERMFFVVIIIKTVLTIQNSRQLPCRFSLVTFPFIKKNITFNGSMVVRGLALKGKQPWRKKKIRLRRSLRMDDFR